MTDLEEELKKTSVGRQFLEEAEPEKQTDNLIEFAKDQCEIFPEDSAMGWYLRETLKTCEDTVIREEVIKAIDRHTFDIDDGLCLDEDISIILEELPPVTPVQRWIPVSERLPKPDEYIKNNGLFNVSDGNRSYSEWFDIYDKKRFGEPTMDGFRVDKRVTAWMPLPEPYKAEMESEE